jgi:AraC-like DNA-binding protein
MSILAALKTEKSLALTQLLYWPDVFAFVGPLEQVATHAHRAPALLLALDGPIRVRERDGRWEMTEATLVPADWAHALDCAGRDIAVVYFDPIAFRHQRTRGPWSTAGKRLLRDVLGGALDAARADHLREALLQELAPRAGLRASHNDSRMEALRQSLLQQPDWTLSQAAAARRVGLSPDRFSHWFSERAGQSWTAYRNWMRLLSTCGELGRRDDALTTIALDGGYSSPAHFSAVFRGSFGITPTRLRRSRPTVQGYAAPTPAGETTYF